MDTTPRRAGGSDSREALFRTSRLISTMAEANAFAEDYMGDYNRRFAQAPAMPQDAYRPLRASDDLNEVFRWKEQRRLTNNLAIHYKRMMFIVEETSAALDARGQLVDVHETIDGAVRIQHRGRELQATPFRKSGEVRQQDVVDNKHLGRILEGVRQAQMAADEQALASQRRSARRRRWSRRSSADVPRRPPCPPPRAVPVPAPTSGSTPLREPQHGAGAAGSPLASVMRRLQTDEWKEEIARVTKPRRRAS